MAEGGERRHLFLARLLLWSLETADENATSQSLSPLRLVASLEGEILAKGQEHHQVTDRV